MKRSQSNSASATRRDFLKLAAAAAVGVPHLVPSSVFGATAPSNRIGVGFIGLGNQSTIDLPAFLINDDVQVVAVCDVNTASYGYKTDKQFLGRKPGQEKVNAHYAGKLGPAAYKGCDACNDFREMLGRRDVDVVAIVVPDHWHGLMATMAAQAGKDMYCEKPLSLTIDQGKKMVEAVRKHKRILQCGSHYRSSPANRLGCELVRNGRIGKLQRILTFLPPNNAEDPGPGWQPMPVPEGFDYETWLGPAPAAPYHKDRCFYRFRFIRDYSGGQTTNFGAHEIDIGQWGNGSDATGPIEFEDLGSEFPPKGGLFNTATKIHFRARYANGVELICETKEPGFGTRFEGSEGWVLFNYKGLTTSPESLKTSTIGPQEIHLYESIKGRKETTQKQYIPDHVRNFLDCVRTRQEPAAPVEIAHRTATICHLGNIAMLLGRKIRWDPVKEQILGDDEAQAMLSRPLRQPWHF